MGEVLRDPWLEQETRGYRRDLLADMIVRNALNLENGEIDGKDLDATSYLLAQLDPEEVADAMDVAERELEVLEEESGF